MANLVLEPHVRWAVAELLAQAREDAGFTPLDVARAYGLKVKAITNTELPDRRLISTVAVACFAERIPAVTTSVLELLPPRDRESMVAEFHKRGLPIGRLGPDRMPVTSSIGHALAAQLRGERELRRVDIERVASVARVAPDAVEAFEGERDPRPPAAIVGAYFATLGFDPVDNNAVLGHLKVASMVRVAGDLPATEVMPPLTSDVRRDMAAEIRGGLHARGMTRAEVAAEACIPGTLYDRLQARDFRGPVTVAAIGRLAAIGEGTDLSRIPWSDDVAQHVTRAQAQWGQGARAARPDRTVALPAASDAVRPATRADIGIA